jgi:hypothetical protein
MAEKKREEKRRSSAGREGTAAAVPSREPSPSWHEPRGVEQQIADADKLARTGSTDEKVRDTPPAGPWNDTSGN